ncbi:MAG: Fe-Mn family superoxide dismutase [Candidatus Paceibacterota bacterium]|jgi:Fe-Mn family superoxide dismutase
MFTEKKFNIPTLKGISSKNIEEHLKLYAGYVKHTNLILEKIPEYEKYVKDDPSASYTLTLLQRRFSFEFDGMRNHEYYFTHFEGGPRPLLVGSELSKKLEEEWGSVESWLAKFKAMALTRGIGWVMLYYDPVSGKLLNAWVEEQHTGHLTGLQPIIALDMWEHSFIADYQPSGKKSYIEDFFANLNWETVEDNFKKASGTY